VIYGGKREYALAQRLYGKPLDPGKITGLRDNLLCHRQHRSLGIGGVSRIPNWGLAEGGSTARDA
jgi:hypothetical protein